MAVRDSFSVYNLPQLANERFAKYFWETFAPQNEQVLKDVCTEENLRTFEATRAGLPLITTFKDFVKFPDNWRDILTKDVYVLSVNLRIRGGETEFAKFTNALYPKKK